MTPEMREFLLEQIRNRMKFKFFFSVCELQEVLVHVSSPKSFKPNENSELFA